MTYRPCVAEQQILREEAPARLPLIEEVLLPAKKLVKNSSSVATVSRTLVNCACTHLAATLSQTVLPIVAAMCARIRLLTDTLHGRNLT